jgi:hypothetical protein
MELLELELMEYNIQILTPQAEAEGAVDTEEEQVLMVTRRALVLVAEEVVILTQLSLQLIIQIAY